MNVLITNNTLGPRGGSELYVRDVALALTRAGHRVGAYSGLLGAVALELQRAGVAVVDRLGNLPWKPDVIHGQHHLETMTAILHFPDVPAVYVCHGFVPWEETPPLHPRVLRYAAVDQMTLESSVGRHGVPPERIRLMMNFVDLGRFRKRGYTPERPRRALLFGSFATPEFLSPVVAEGCRLRGVEFDAVGSGMGNASECPEDLLGGYDLVFAKGRSALESMACGAAVVVCGINGVGPLVGSARFDRLRTMNFGSRSLMVPATPEEVARRIDDYDAADARAVCARVRGEAGLDQAVVALLALYQEAMEEFGRTPADERAAGGAAGAYLARIAAEAKALRGELKRLKLESQGLRGELERLKLESQGLRAELGQRELESERRRAELERLKGAITLRVLSRILRVPLLGGALRSVERSVKKRGHPP